MMFQKPIIVVKQSRTAVIYEVYEQAEFEELMKNHEFANSTAVDETFRGIKFYR